MAMVCWGCLHKWLWYAGGVYMNGYGMLGVFTYMAMVCWGCLHKWLWYAGVVYMNGYGMLGVFT